jgi:NAD(P)-dependent dehydrogenase (short-subunit alcohol dehydrogenase family)
MELNGKVAIVTGASRGIGKAIAKAIGKAIALGLAKEGADVTVVARTEKENLQLPASLLSTVGIRTGLSAPTTTF